MGFSFKKVAEKSYGFLQKAMPWVGAVAASVASSNPMPLLAQVAQQISQTTNKAVEPTPDSINAAVQGATQDQLIQIRQIDNDFASKMKQLGFENEQQLASITAADRDSARKMQVGTGSYMPPVLAVLAVVALLICIWMIAFHPTQPQGHDALLMLLGALIAAYKDVYGFFFGSSAGQDKATELLSQSPPVQK